MSDRLVKRELFSEKMFPTQFYKIAQEIKLSRSNT